MPRCLVLLGVSFGLWVAVAAVARAEEEEAVKVYRDVEGSVASLKNVEGSGTGIVLDKTGLILTNAHVVASPLPFRCLLEVVRNGKTETVSFANVKVAGFHPKLDLALVRIDPKEVPGSTLQPAHLGKVKGIPGQRVYAIGNPGAGNVALTKTITAGILSGVDRQIEGIAYYQVDAPINPGNSGGPLVDKHGDVLGLVTLKFTDGENLGFAIPLQELKVEEFQPLSKLRGDPERARKLLELAGQYSAQGAARAKAHGIDDDGAKMYNYLAAECFHMALKYDPGNHAIYYNVGMLLRTLDADEVGAAYLWEAIRLNPWGNETGDYYRELGLALVKLKQRAEAYTVWTEGVAKHPRTAGKIWEDLAIYFMEEKDLFQAAYAGNMAVYLKDPATRVPLMQQLVNEASSRLDDAGKKKLSAATGRFEALLADCDRRAKEARRQNARNMTPAFGKLLDRMARGEESDQPEKIAAEAVSSAAPAVSRGAEAAPEAAPKPALDLSIPAGAHDLLADIHLKDDAVKGAWKFEGRTLVSPLAPGALLQLSTKLPAEYDVTVIVERKGNQKELVLGFVREGVQSAFLVDVGGTKSGLDPDAREAYSRQVLAVNKPVTLVLKVRKEGLMVTADDAKVFFERSAAPFAAAPADWKPPADDKLFLGANVSRFVVHKLMLTPYERK